MTDEDVGNSERKTLENNKLFLDSCSSNLNYARNILLKIEDTTDKEIRLYLFEYMAIVYLRCFKKSAIRGKTIRELDIGYIENEYHEHHTKLKHYRDKYYVHSDIKNLEPKFDQNSYLINQDNHPYIFDKKTGNPKFLIDDLDSLRSMFEKIIERIYKEIDEVELKLKT